MKQSQHYHNTTQQPKKVVVAETKKALSQAEKVLKLFKVHKKLSASKVFNLYQLIKEPKEVVILTSIRRAISNLSYENKIEILLETATGIYGKPEHYYRLVS